MDATPPPRPPSPSPWGHRGPWVLFAALVVGAVAIVVAIPLLVPAVGFGVVEHEVCTTGSVLESRLFWTPIILLNSPYRGNAWANGSGWGINASNGAAVGIFRALDWRLSARENSSAPGPGLATPCTTDLSASYLTTSASGFETELLLPAGSMDDVGEATSFSLNGNASVLFDNTPTSMLSGGFQVDNCLTWNLPSANASSGVYPITVPFPGSGDRYFVSLLFPAPATYAYKFPFDGAWAAGYAVKDSASVSEGGLTFTTLSCTRAPPPVAPYP